MLIIYVPTVSNRMTALEGLITIYNAKYGRPWTKEKEFVLVQNQ